MRDEGPPGKSSVAHRRRRAQVVGTFQHASLKTTLGLTKCTLSICICEVSEAELPVRYIWSRTTFSHVRLGTTVNHMCGRERAAGYVQYLFPFVSCFPAPFPFSPLPPSLLLMASAITRNRALPAGRKWWFSLTVRLFQGICAYCEMKRVLIALKWKDSSRIPTTNRISVDATAVIHVLLGWKQEGRAWHNLVLLPSKCTNS